MFFPMYMEKTFGILFWDLLFATFGCCKVSKNSQSKNVPNCGKDVKSRPESSGLTLISS
ncbi:Uncharacterized protein TCM_031051 [Theobroma cacao]|uniref:Lipoprotein n=1 Tax=Theobroma cacao TaxID=3641 RepID=A0A061FDG6_THECC|nr:Uncharacterized protein TCM_031051 [Theobroma cacao]